MVDRSELADLVILIADRGYEAYNSMAYIEQKGWNYLVRVKKKRVCPKFCVNTAGQCKIEQKFFKAGAAPAAAALSTK